MTNEIEYELQVLPAALMMQHILDDDTVLRLNNYLDVLRNDTSRTSAGPDLVGQIHQGEQIIMDYQSPILKPFVSIVESLGLAYLRHFVEQTKTPLVSKKIDVDKLWSVHSFAGDYNPIHDHLTTSPMGISFTCWTKVPPQIGELDDDTNISLYDSSGAIDGFINFTYGLNQSKDPERLRPPQQVMIKPAVGKLLLFPSWMQHCVYPFKGEGERRTVAGNLNCHSITKNEFEEIQNETRNI
tara:strand:- start:307 stop:1029 length:723 start_codon:yes stop_codon:yes gene_type:complete